MSLSDTAYHIDDQSESTCAANIMDKQGSTYVLVADNIDKTVNPQYMTVDHQRQSLHYVHMYAALDRVSCTTLQNNERGGNVMDLNTSAFLLMAEDSKILWQPCWGG